MAQDTFTRSTSFGLGTDGTFTYTWSDRDSGFDSAAESTLHVDGSQVVMPNDEFWDSYILDSPTLALTGTVAFDTFFPVIDYDTEYWHTISFHIQHASQTAFGDNVTIPFGFRQTDGATVMYGTFDGNFHRAFDIFGNSIPDPTIVIDPGNWYTIKCSYDLPGRHYGIKMWKRSDPEPDDWGQTVTTNDDWGYLESFGDGHDGKSWIDFWFWSNVESYLDNLTTGAYEQVPHQVSAYAVIRGHQEAEFCDPLSITSSYGMGPEYPFIPLSGDTVSDSFAKSTINDETLAFVFGDGSKITTTTVSTTTRNAYAIPGRRAEAGYAQFDFFVPTPNPSVNSNGSGIKVLLDRDRAFSQGFGVQVVGLLGGGSTFNMQALHTYTSGATSAFVFAPTNNTWYTIKVMYDGTGRQTVLVKVQGDPDSAAINSNEQNLQFESQGTGDRVVFSRNLNGNTIALDNLCALGLRITIDSIIGNPAGQFSLAINAVFQRTQTGSFAIDARVSQSLDRFTINSLLLRTQAGSVFLDAALAAKGFLVDGFITDNGLLRHFRDRDHDGTLLDTSVVLTDDLGPWQAGATLREILVDLWAWVEKRL